MPAIVLQHQRQFKAVTHRHIHQLLVILLEVGLADVLVHHRRKLVRLLCAHVVTQRSLRLVRRGKPVSQHTVREGVIVDERDIQVRDDFAVAGGELRRLIEVMQVLLVRRGQKHRPQLEMRTLGLQYCHVVLEHFEVDDLAVLGRYNSAECFDLWLISNHSQSRRARLQMLLLRLHLCQLVPANHTLLLTALLIEHLQAQLLGLE